MNSLDDFKKFIANFGWLGGLAAATSVLFPLITSGVGFAPPGFDGLPFLTSLVMIIFLISAFIFGANLSEKLFKRLFILTSALFISSIFIYMYTFDRFVHKEYSKIEVDGRIEIEVKNVVVGCKINKKYDVMLKEQYGDDYDCPGHVTEYLEDNKKDPNKIWDTDSIRHIKFTIFALWMLLYSSLTIIFGFFLVRLRSNTLPQEPTPPVNPLP